MTSAEYNSELAANLYFLITSHRVQLATNVFVLYDHVITLSREVRLFWFPEKFSVACILFFVNRYWVLVTAILELSPYGGFYSDNGYMFSRGRCCYLWLTMRHSCNILDRLLGMMSPLEYTIFGTFTAMRAYALSQNAWLASITLLMSLAPFAVNLAQFCLGRGGEKAPGIVQGCSGTENTTVMEAFIFIIVSRGGQIIADAIMISITWYKLGKGHANSIGSNLSSQLSNRTTFSAILLWDGTLYFIAILILNVLQLVMPLYSLLTGRIPEVNDVAYFTPPLTAILISRFLLDLQQASRREMKLNSDDPLHFSQDSMRSVSFARVAGSLTATLDMRSTAYTQSEDKYEFDDRVNRRDGETRLECDRPLMDLDTR